MYCANLRGEGLWSIHTSLSIFQHFCVGFVITSLERLLPRCLKTCFAHSRVISSGNMEFFAMMQELEQRLGRVCVRAMDQTSSTVVSGREPA